MRCVYPEETGKPGQRKGKEEKEEDDKADKIEGNNMNARIIE